MMDVQQSAAEFREDFQRLHDEVAKVIVGAEDDHAETPVQGRAGCRGVWPSP